MLEALRNVPQEVADTYNNLAKARPRLARWNQSRDTMLNLRVSTSRNTGGRPLVPYDGGMTITQNNVRMASS